jgi:hypothetical protein
MSTSGKQPKRPPPASKADQSAVKWPDGGGHPLGKGNSPGIGATVARATRWTCSCCGVSAGQMDGRPTKLPEGWTNSEGELCLICRRERAADAVLESAPEVRNMAARVRLRKAALLDFEVSRVPDRSNGQIAGACHTSPRAVAESRERLQSAADARPAEQ